MKNIYVARISDADKLAGRYSSKTGHLACWSLESKGVSWSSYLFIPDLSATDMICFDVLFEEDFRKENDVNKGDRFKMSSPEGVADVEIIDIKQGEPINNLENKVPWGERSPYLKGE